MFLSAKHIFLSKESVGEWGGGGVEDYKWGGGPTESNAPADAAAAVTSERVRHSRAPLAKPLTATRRSQVP